MLVQIEGDNVTQALEEALYKFPIFGREEESRNGPVLTMPGPTFITVHRPLERVLFDPRRDANPYFHLAEFVWMMSGSNDVRFIELFNRRMRDYADSGSDIHHGAYGHRWRRHFGTDQIRAVSKMLHDDPTTRRAVLGMWDPRTDLEFHNDLPCNTHIYWRVHDGYLNMTVCTRSNDLIWGCLGANAVHMTLLFELMARSSGHLVGTYQVFTNNLHMYKGRKDYALLEAVPLRDDYRRPPFVQTQRLLQKDETLEQLLSDSERFVKTQEFSGYQTHWFRSTFIPAMKNFQSRKLVEEIAAGDWRIACNEWLARRSS